MLAKRINGNVGFRSLTASELEKISGGEGDNEIIVTASRPGGGGGMGGGTYMGGGTAGGSFGGPPPGETQEAPTDPDADNPPDPTDIGIQVGDAEITPSITEDGKLKLDVDASPAQLSAGVTFDLETLSVDDISVGWAGFEFEFNPDFSDLGATYTDTQGGWTLSATFSADSSGETKGQLEFKITF